MSIYINVAMGLGGNISLTYVTKELKEKYGKVCVMSPYWDVFKCDPNVSKVYKPDEARDFIFDAEEEDGLIINHRLYDMSDFIKKRLSYSDAWRLLTGLKVKGDKEGSSGEHVLDISNFPGIKPQVENVLKIIKDKGYENFILINFEGGVSPLTQVPVVDGKPDWSKVPDPYENEPLARLYPRELASKFVTLFKEKYPKTAIVNYSLPNQGDYEGDLKFVIPYLAYYELSKHSIGAVTIDSSLQHLITGNCPVITLWGHSLPQSFGHIGNHNIIQKCRRNDILYFTMLGKSGAKIDYIKPEELLQEVENVFKLEK